jgi:hypothetical protein
MNEKVSKEYLTGYSNGFDDGKKTGRTEMANELTKVIRELCGGRTISISSVIKAINELK